jgi:hypothetical protein
MNMVIWSKNRACQLDLLLRSIKRYWNRYDRNIFKVVYDYDNAEYKKGYDKVMERYDWPRYVCEVNFKSDVLTRVLDDNKYIGFFCDDDVFTREFEWNMGLMLDPSMLCISLRMGKNITSHYIKGPCQVPEITYGAWEWQGKSIDWGYPMSVGSGHIFRMEDIKPILEKGTYANPTELEDAMNANKIKRAKMFCYDHSIVLNLAINRVQDKRETLCGDITAKELNDRYLDGKQIDLAPFHYYANTSAHEIVKELKWLN